MFVVLGSSIPAKKLHICAYFQLKNLDGSYHICRLLKPPPSACMTIKMPSLVQTVRLRARGQEDKLATWDYFHFPGGCDCLTTQ